MTNGSGGARSCGAGRCLPSDFRLWAPRLHVAAAARYRRHLEGATLREPLPLDAGLLLASDLPIERGAALQASYEWKDYLSARVLARLRARARGRRHHRSRSRASRRSTRRSRGCRTPRATSNRVPGDRRVARAGRCGAAATAEPRLPAARRNSGPGSGRRRAVLRPGPAVHDAVHDLTGGIGWRSDMVADADAPDGAKRPVRDVPDAALPKPGGHL